MKVKVYFLLKNSNCVVFCFCILAHFVTNVGVRVLVGSENVSSLWRVKVKVFHAVAGVIIL